MMTLMFIPFFSWLSIHKFKIGRALLTAGMLTLIGILFVFQNNQGGSLTDYDAYYSLWNYLSAGGDWRFRLDGGYESDIGFTMIMKFVTIFTMKFEVFLFVIYAVSLFFFGLGMSKITKAAFEFAPTKSLLITIYFMYPFVYDLTQIRFLLSYSIIFLGISNLITSEKSSKRLFIFLVLFATFVHKANIVYLFLAFSNNDRFWKYFRKLIPILSIIFFASRKYIFNLSVVSKVLGGKDKYLLIEKDVSIYSGIFMSLTLLYYIIITIYICKELKKKNISFLNIDIIININISMLVLIPFLFQTLDVERIFRPLYLINWIIIFGSIKFFKSSLIKTMLIAPIFIIQILNVFRLREFITQMFSNVF